MTINLPDYGETFLATAAALANSGGGAIRIGLDENGEAVGLTGYKALMERLPKLCEEKLSLNVSVSLRYQGDYHYLEVKIPSALMPLIYDGRVLVRRGGKNVPLEQKDFEKLLKEHFPVISDYLPLGSSTVGEVLLNGDPSKSFPKVKANIEASFSTALKELKTKFPSYPEEIFKKTLLYFYLINDYEIGDVSLSTGEDTVSVKIEGRAAHPYLREAFEEAGNEVSLIALNNAFDLAAELGYPRPVLTSFSVTIDTRHKRKNEKEGEEKLGAEERMLLLLEEEGPLSLGEISDRMKFSNRTACALLTSLLKRGLVSTDRKVWCCSSTPPRDSLEA